MFRVFVTEKHTFKAVAPGTRPEDENISNSFESEYWQQFQIELLRRLSYGKESKIRETTSGEARRKSDF